MKIYMAGPLFSTAELAFNRELASLLRGRGHDVFLPQEHEQRKDVPSAIFESDLKGLE
jgi:nucleoside 2-deoxyribosyltransferase